jgi:hypothetical protein
MFHVELSVQQYFPACSLNSVEHTRKIYANRLIITIFITNNKEGINFSLFHGNYCSILIR